MLVILKAHNKTLLAQATPAGTAYRVVRSKAGRYAALTHVAQRATLYE